MTKGLKGFQPGNKVAIGNPGPQGRRFITQHLVARLNEVNPKTKVSRVRKICENLVELAEEGKDLSAIKEIVDRVEGKAVQAVELTGRDGRPVESVTATMTLREIARMYSQTLGSLEPELADDDDQEDTNVVSIESARKKSDEE